MKLVEQITAKAPTRADSLRLREKFGSTAPRRGVDRLTPSHVRSPEAIGPENHHAGNRQPNRRGLGYVGMPLAVVYEAAPAVIGSK